MKLRYIFKSIFDSLFIIGTVLLTLLSLAGYFGFFHKYLELTSHFKLQYLVISFCPFFFFLLKRHIWVFNLSLFCLLLNLYQIAPWYFPQVLASSSEIQGQKIRVLQSNINKHNHHYSQLFSLVREENPDLAVILEVSKTNAKKFEVLRSTFPYSIFAQDGDIEGTLVYSKLPLRNASVKSIGEGRKSILANLTIQDQTISLITAHPSQTLGKFYYEERNRQLEAIADYVAKLKKPLLVGDFNVTMWSPYYKRFINTSKLRNTRRGFGILPTWPSYYPLLSIPIDHCFVRDDIKVLKIRIGRKVGSDHLPVITDLLIPTKSS